MKLLVNARVYAYEPSTRSYRRHESLLIDGSSIVGLDADPTGAGVDTVDMQGATILPAFADCHVHVTDTGYFLAERNLNATRSYDEFFTAVGRVGREYGVVFAGQYDESSWDGVRLADAAPLEHFHAGDRAMLVRIDGHSSIVNAATLAWLGLAPDTQGIERDAAGKPTGKLFLEANWRAQAAFMETLSLEAKRAAERRAVEMAIARGNLHLHAQLVGFARDGYAGEIAALKSLPAKWYPKICEPDPQLAADLGLRYVGGDVFLDGSIGSCTAAVSEPFLVNMTGDSPGKGGLKYSDDQVYAYFATAEALGISAGVHAIGDRAIEQCIATWERVLGGKPSNRGTRHFIEHFEIALPEHIEACARMGIYLSMQPQFDELWGGLGRMYDDRLGTPRMRSMNALGRAQRAGAVLCGGDDSPVCDLNPLAGMQACVDHHEPQERLTPEEALTMYTYNAARLGFAEDRTGRLAAGFAADLAILDRDPLAGAGFADCVVLQTWSDGEVVFSKT
jgi:predicted amidohydrolase YtcJ